MFANATIAKLRKMHAKRTGDKGNTELEEPITDKRLRNIAFASFLLRAVCSKGGEDTDEQREDKDHVLTPLNDPAFKQVTRDF